MTRENKLPRDVPDIAALALDYDIFFLDQFGVLHDGINAYPGAVEAVSGLKKMGKTILLISNSGKRATPNAARLRKLGFIEGSWDAFLSSGEVAWRIFSGQTGEPALAPGTRCLLIARDDDRSAIEGVGFEPVDDGARADLVVISGSQGEIHPLAHYDRMIEGAARRGVPCFCTNPDKIMLTASGPSFGAGRIAERYEDFGGTVRWIGKPHREIYDAALSALGNPPRDRVICIGDSIEHDIAGAQSAGLASCLVRSGILADLSPAELQQELARHAAMPDFVTPAFVLNAPRDPA